MASWDDDEFEVPVVTETAKLKTNWEDEEEEAEPEPIVSKPSAAVQQAKLKREKEEALKLENKLKLAQLEDETADERKIRERKQVEDADNELTGELFGTSVSNGKSSGGTVSAARGVAGIALKTKQEHTVFGQACCHKLAESSAFNIAAFYKSLSDCLNEKVPCEVLDEIIGTISKIREKKSEKPAQKNQNNKKSKKQLQEESKKHSDVFGPSDFVDKYDADYGDMEDKYLF